MPILIRIMLADYKISYAVTSSILLVLLEICPPDWGFMEAATLGGWSHNLPSPSRAGHVTFLSVSTVLYRVG